MPSVRTCMCASNFPVSFQHLPAVFWTRVVGSCISHTPYTSPASKIVQYLQVQINSSFVQPGANAQANVSLNEAICQCVLCYISALHQYGSLYYSTLSTRRITCRFNWERLGRCGPLREGSWWSKRCWRVAEGGTLVAKPAVGSTVLPQGSVKLGIWKCIESVYVYIYISYAAPVCIYEKGDISLKYVWTTKILKHTCILQMVKVTHLPDREVRQLGFGSWENSCRLDWSCLIPRKDWRLTLPSPPISRELSSTSACDLLVVVFRCQARVWRKLAPGVLKFV